MPIAIHTRTLTGNEMQTMLDTLRADPLRIIAIDGRDPFLPSARAYLTKSGKSVCVILDAPIDPRNSLPISKPHEVYLPLDWVVGATEPIHLLNAASHKARRWLNETRDDYWYALVVIACRPLRRSCTSLLQAIAKVARHRWGDKYWRNPDARKMLYREIEAMGIKLPPSDGALRFVSLIGCTEPVNAWPDRLSGQ